MNDFTPSVDEWVSARLFYRESESGYQNNVIMENRLNFKGVKNF